MHIILATDARQSTVQSGIDMDKTPLTEKNFDETLAKALEKFPKLPELERAQIIFVLPGVSTKAKTPNSFDILEKFWTEYLSQAAPTARVHLSTILVPFEPEKTEDSGRNKP